MCAVEKDAVMKERDQLRVLYDNFRGHYDNIKAEVTTYQKHLGEEMQARKENELALESRIAEQRRQLDSKTREMEQMAQRVQLPVDADILRLKIQKDLEARHRQDLELRVQENERLQDQFYEAKRQLEVTKTQLESHRFESEKDLQDVKERLKAEVQELMLENQALQAKCDDRRDRDLIKQLRRDLDESRRKSQDLTAEANEMRRERDQLRLEKNEMFLQNQKTIEQLKSANRDMQSAVERA